MRTMRGAREKLPGARAHLYGLAGCRFALHARNRTGKYPRMPALERLLAPGFENQRVHENLLNRQGAKAAKKTGIWTKTNMDQKNVYGSLPQEIGPGSLRREQAADAEAVAPPWCIRLFYLLFRSSWRPWRLGG